MYVYASISYTLRPYNFFVNFSGILFLISIILSIQYHFVMFCLRTALVVSCILFVVGAGQSPLVIIPGDGGSQMEGSFFKHLSLILLISCTIYCYS